jgi:hypothetical protein
LMKVLRLVVMFRLSVGGKMPLLKPGKAGQVSDENPG